VIKAASRRERWAAIFSICRRLSEGGALSVCGALSDCGVLSEVGVLSVGVASALQAQQASVTGTPAALAEPWSQSSGFAK
jgi:hypothetical protein